jgi:hypothetical protein
VSWFSLVVVQYSLSVVSPVVAGVSDTDAAVLAAVETSVLVGFSALVMVVVAGVVESPRSRATWLVEVVVIQAVCVNPPRFGPPPSAVHDPDPII